MVAALSACSTPAPQPVLQSQQSIPVDFSGSWEMDYGRSDSVNDRLDSVYRELKRQADRVANNPNSRDAALLSSLNARMSGLVNLARFADLVSESQVLEIEQTERDIAVEREGDFTLNCGFYEERPSVDTEALGSEICGWSGHQLLFQVALPDGTSIRYRLTMDPAGDRLHIATTVANRTSTDPFTLNRYYYRFEPLPEDYNCEYTLTRGQVCTRKSS